MHLKLGLMKNFVTAMNQEEAAFTYLREKFHRLREAKLKEGIFFGPQIRDLIKDEYFDKLFQGDETFLQWRRDIKGHGTVLCSPTAGLWQGMPLLPWNISNRQNGKKKKRIT
jgi:hypothetical protein